MRCVHVCPIHTYVDLCVCLLCLHGLEHNPWCMFYCTCVYVCLVLHRATVFTLYVLLGSYSVELI